MGDLRVRLVAPFLLITAVGGLISSVPLVLAGLLGGGLALLWGTIRVVRAQRDVLGMDSLSPQDRTLLIPVRRLVEQIDTLVKENKGSPAVAVVGAEAQMESRRLFEQCIRLVELRGKLRRALRDDGGSADLAALERRLEAAASSERTSLEATVAARRLEAGQYAKMRDAMASAEASLMQAESALSEIKARLAVSSSQDALDEAGGDELRDTLGRMRALGKGFEEAEEFLRGQVE